MLFRLGIKPWWLVTYRYMTRDIFEVRHSNHSISVPAHS